MTIVALSIRLAEHLRTTSAVKLTGAKRSGKLPTTMGPLK